MDRMLAAKAPGLIAFGGESRLDVQGSIRIRQESGGIVSLPFSRWPSWIATMCLLAVAAPAESAILSAVTTAPAFFNPSLGQVQTIGLQVQKPGTLTVNVLDRDRQPIRAWVVPVSAGPLTLKWDGKDDSGLVVPDEAYNLRLEFRGVGTVETYDPSAHFVAAQSDPPISFYSPESGVLGYMLAGPSRVHAQAGQARRDPVTKVATGPVLKTLVDNAPRVGGAVIEKWSGMDEGGTFSVAVLPDFAVAILATALPPSTMITVGNRSVTAFEYARAHRGSQATRPRDLRASPAQHHLGLTAVEDRTPPLLVEPSGQWDATKREWAASGPLRFKVTVTGDGAPYFLGLPNDVVVFVDEIEALRIPRPSNPLTVSLAASQVPEGKHRIAINWESSLGPTAVGAFVVNVGPGGLRSHRGAR